MRLRLVCIILDCWLFVIFIIFINTHVSKNRMSVNSLAALDFHCPLQFHSTSAYFLYNYITFFCTSDLHPPFLLTGVQRGVHPPVGAGGVPHGGDAPQNEGVLQEQGRPPHHHRSRRLLRLLPHVSVGDEYVLEARPRLRLVTAVATRTAGCSVEAFSTSRTS